MIDKTTRCRELHQIYMTETGLPNPFTMAKQFAWEAWMLHGYEVAELKMVIALLKKKISLGQKWDSALAFRNLIENEENFAEALAEAIARDRERAIMPHAGRASVLRATGREERSVPIPIARSAADILRGNEALKKFLATRDTL